MTGRARRLETAGSELLFTPFSSSGGTDALDRRVSMMLNRIGFFDGLGKGDRVAVKVHPGELHNITYLRPSVARSIVEQLKKRGAVPFVTETTTLYCRERFTPDELTRTAAHNGFSPETLDCPFVVADAGPDVVVKVRGRHLEEVGVAREIAHADALLVVSHVTGHCWTAGLAGALKQLSMGCTGRRTKAEIHLSTTIAVNAGVCDACGKCARVCKTEAVEVIGEEAVMTSRCVRCGACIDSCPTGAITYSHDFGWFARACAEAAGGVLSGFDGGSAVFLNFLTDVTWHCDCEPFSDTPVVSDIGVVCSRDPVAADQASADLINASPPVAGSRADTPEVQAAEDRLLALTGIEWWRQLDEAESLGLGSRHYEMLKVRK